MARETAFRPYVISKGAMRLCFLVVIVAGLTLGSCDFGFNAQSQVRERLENAQEKWQAQEIQTYRFVYQQQRGQTIVDTVEVFVRTGQIDSICTVPEVSDEELLVGTVDSFFDLIEVRIEEDESQFGANFDREQGFPIDYNASFRDGRRDQDIITISVESQE